MKQSLRKFLVALDVILQQLKALVTDAPSSLPAEPAQPQKDRCEHGVLWSMECLSCGHSDFESAPAQPEDGENLNL